MHTIGTDEISRLNTKFVCITETAVEILSLPIDKYEIQREEEEKLPGRVISTKLSNQAWGGARLLILTHE